MPTKAQTSEEDNRDYFSFTVEEKIGLPNYSHVIVRATLGRSVDDSEEERDEVISLVESLIARERQVVLDDLGVEVKSA